MPAMVVGARKLLSAEIVHCTNNWRAVLKGIVQIYEQGLGVQKTKYTTLKFQF